MSDLKLEDMGPSMAWMDGDYAHPTEQPEPPRWEPEELETKSNKRRLFSLLISYFPDALEEVCKASEYGALKYAPGAWRAVVQEEFEEAVARHLFELGRGCVVDVEPCKMGHEPLYHWAQVAWNALAVMQKILEKTDP